MSGHTGPELALVAADGQTWQRTGIAGAGELPSDAVLAQIATTDAPAEPVEEGLLLPPVVPRCIVGIGLNYRAHAVEQGRPLPDFPSMFLKHSRSLAPPFGDLPLRAHGDQLDYEAELGIVIGRDIFGCGPEEAAAAIAGWVIVQDYTWRDLARPETLAIAKGGPGMAPIGPWITTTRSIPIKDAGALRIQCRVNGELRQDALASDMRFGPVELVEHVARRLPLGPGDVIATGSPSGSGVGMDPPRWLAAGDVVETAITGLGQLRQQVIGPA